MEIAGCYAPGGRYPLPSSVLMTVITARVSGVKTVWVASPRPSPLTVAAAYVAGATMMLCAGGAQAIGAFAHGAGVIPPCDVIVGPGNKFVTAAKALVSGVVKIDMLAGPSEVLVIADESADPAVVASDLLAQAEHDPDSSAILITVGDETLAGKIDKELVAQLAVLETRDVAGLALANNSYTISVGTVEEACLISDKIAPEHLEIHVRNASNYKMLPNHYGSLFLGHMSAEVLGDYCAGPNHVLPTRGTARYSGGLSIFTFLRVRTWLDCHADSGASQLVKDATQLGKLEGLVGHSAAAARRLPLTLPPPQQIEKHIMSRYIRSDFKDLPPYTPIKPFDVVAEEIGLPISALVKLDANENAYGPITEVIEAINAVDSNHIYPDPGQTYLRTAIGKRHGIQKDKVICGCGADDILDILIRLVPDRPIVVTGPTFGMYR